MIAVKIFITGLSGILFSAETVARQPIDLESVFGETVEVSCFQVIVGELPFDYRCLCQF